jgi:hypothetical protein
MHDALDGKEASKDYTCRQEPTGRYGHRAMAMEPWGIAVGGV